MNIPSCFAKVIAPLLAVAVLPLMRAAEAQAPRIASVAAVQHIAEKKEGATTWRRAGKGAPLVVDSRLRTGKRSKADVRFTDGSLLRLGQLSSVEFKTAKGVTLTGGQLLYAALKPGRVLAGSAAAEIKGSVALNRLNADNSVDAELFLGATDITTEKGTIELKPGQGVTAFPDGRFSPIRSASPRAYGRDGAQAELLEAPVAGPFVGSTAQVPVRTAPERNSTENYKGVARGRKGLNDFANPKGNRGRDKDKPGRGGSKLVAQSSISESSLTVEPASSLSGSVFFGSASHEAGQLGGPRRFEDESPEVPVRLAQAPASATDDVARAVDTATDLGLSEKDALNTAAARRHLDEIDADQGRVFGVDAALLAVLADGGTALYGGQIHGFFGRGKFLADVSLQPLRLRRSGQPTQDYTAFDSANIRYRDSWGEIQVGRQRFIAGPTQATLFGSLVRQGAREIMDAARISPKLNNGVSFEAAYLIDAYPRNLPYRISGRQQGFYARAAIEREFGNFGVNVLSYRGLSTTTGGTIDFAVPLVRDKVEFYGEVGRDVFRRRLTTVGLTFPVLFDKADIDLAIEYSNLGASRNAAAPPNELAVRAYRRVGNNVDLLATLSRFSGTMRDTSLVVGISVGARLVGDGNRYSQ